MPRTSLAGLVAAVLFLAGCPEYQYRSPGCEPGATGRRAYDALGYHLAATFDWGASVLRGTEEVTVAVCPGGGRTIELDAGVAVARVLLDGEELPFTHDAGAATLVVELPPRATDGRPITFSVEYLAPAGNRGLVATTSVARDPVRSRVVFTDSEPREGHTWLVEKDDPSDRALFSVVLDLPPGEDAVANGERFLDEPIAGGGRRVGHALDVPIPTYLMAFAAGELEHAERPYVSPVVAGETLPLALWWRRGVPAHPAAHLDAVEVALERFERLLGPYPFARYAVVLLPPPFGGGMENATITFNSERSGTGCISFGLNAHELAHQWLGDWVTMETYDDVWVKEGMATLLAAEADRGRRAAEGEGRLFGGDFFYRPTDAIVDPALTGIAKYTSGPYDRAAALLTEVRAIVGEEAFWRSVRAFLALHAKGSATGEEFLRSFAPDLEERTLERILARLPRKEVATFVIEPSGDQVTFGLQDPSRELLLPYEITTVSAAGQANVHTLRAGESLTLAVPPGGYLAVDERDVHSFTSWADAALEPRCPASPGAARAAFVSRSSRQQEQAAFACAPATPAAFLELAAALDSVDARIQLAAGACRQVAGPELFEALSSYLGTPLREEFDFTLMVNCPNLGPAFEEEFLALASTLAPGDLARLEYLMSFSFGFGPAGQASLEALAGTAPTMKLRDLARGIAGPPGARRAPAHSAPAEPHAVEGKAARRGGGPAW